MNSNVFLVTVICALVTDCRSPSTRHTRHHSSPSLYSRYLPSSSLSNISFETVTPFSLLVSLNTRSLPSASPIPVPTQYQYFFILSLSYLLAFYLPPCSPRTPF